MSSRRVARPRYRTSSSGISRPIPNRARPSSTRTRTSVGASSKKRRRRRRAPRRLSRPVSPPLTYQDEKDAVLYLLERLESKRGSPSRTAPRPLRSRNSSVARRRKKAYSRYAPKQNSTVLKGTFSSRLRRAMTGEEYEQEGYTRQKERDLDLAPQDTPEYRLAQSKRQERERERMRARRARHRRVNSTSRVSRRRRSSVVGQGRVGKVSSGSTSTSSTSPSPSLRAGEYQLTPRGLTSRSSEVLLGKRRFPLTAGPGFSPGGSAEAPELSTSPSTPKLNAANSVTPGSSSSSSTLERVHSAPIAIRVVGTPSGAGLGESPITTLLKQLEARNIARRKSQSQSGSPAAATATAGLNRRGVSGVGGVAEDSDSADESYDEESDLEGECESQSDDGDDRFSPARQTRTRSRGHSQPIFIGGSKSTLKGKASTCLDDDDLLLMGVFSTEEPEIEDISRSGRPKSPSASPSRSPSKSSKSSQSPAGGRRKGPRKGRGRRRGGPAPKTTRILQRTALNRRRARARARARKAKREIKKPGDDDPRGGDRGNGGDEEEYPSGPLIIRPAEYEAIAAKHKSEENRDSALELQRQKDLERHSGEMAALNAEMRKDSAPVADFSGGRTAVTLFETSFAPVTPRKRFVTRGVSTENGTSAAREPVRERTEASMNTFGEFIAAEKFIQALNKLREITEHATQLRSRNRKQALKLASVENELKKAKEDAEAARTRSRRRRRRGNEQAQPSSEKKRNPVAEVQAQARVPEPLSAPLVMAEAPKQPVIVPVKPKARIPEEPASARILPNRNRPSGPRVVPSSQLPSSLQLPGIRTSKPRNPMTPFLSWLRGRYKAQKGGVDGELGVEIERLRAASAEPSLEEGYEIHYHCYNGTVLKIVEMAKDGADLNMLDAHNRCGLHYAALQNRTQTLRALCRRKDVQVDVSDSFGYTPLALAAMESNSECCRILMRIGRADRKRPSQTTRRLTPEQLAADDGTARVFREQQDLEDRFFAAVLSKDVKGVKSLSIDMIDVNCRNRAGQTPLEVALDTSDNHELVGVLLDLQAVPEKPMLKNPNDPYVPALTVARRRYMREKVVTEMLQTERTYADDLQYAVALFANPCLSRKRLARLVRRKDCRTRIVELAGLLLQLRNAHCGSRGFLHGLRIAVSSKTNDVWADHMKVVKHFDAFVTDLYQEYVQLQSYVEDMIKTNREYRDLFKFFKMQAKRIPFPKAQSFFSVLALPRIRIFKYRDLLQRFVDHCEPSQEADLRVAGNAAFQKMSKLLDVLDSIQGDVRNQKELQAMQRLLAQKYRMTSNLTQTPDRRYIVHALDLPCFDMMAEETDTRRRKRRRYEGLLDLIIFSDAFFVGEKDTLTQYPIVSLKSLWNWYEDSFRLTIYKQRRKVFDKFVRFEFAYGWLSKLKDAFLKKALKLKFSSQVLMIPHFDEKNRIDDFLSFVPSSSDVDEAALETRIYLETTAAKRLAECLTRSDNLRGKIQRLHDEVDRIKREMAGTPSSPERTKSKPLPPIPEEDCPVEDEDEESEGEYEYEYVYEDLSEEEEEGIEDGD